MLVLLSLPPPRSLDVPREGQHASFPGSYSQRQNPSDLAKAFLAGPPGQGEGQKVCGILRWVWIRGAGETREDGGAVSPGES